ncbi:MAG TPA: hypothetical protein VFO10_11435 [Oligoflexus sp.]|uniref:hypothetical protein n=1 Tax=Oligoflexus sp. TaxID=1971216 RepID=UPI002D80495A|nr:hypothetical protein [Oligoflexus sp.]HET9237858.1 hypothetical protein [Oligoflexus sp.]
MGIEVKRQEHFSAEDWLGYYRLNQAIFQETYPYRDMVSEEQFLRDPRPLFLMNSGLRCLVLFRNGRMIALSHYRLDSSHSVCTAEVKFLQAGFDDLSSKEMVKTLLAIRDENQLEILQMIVENAQVVQHYQNTGHFQKVGQVRESVLDLQQLDLNLMASWQSQNQGFTLKALSWNDARDVAALVDIYNESNADVPFQNAVGMVRTREASYFLDWVARLQVNDMTMPAFGLYCQDQIAGLALFELRAANPMTATIIYTGVARIFRKRGLGRHLKASSTLHLLGIFPGLRFIVTANEETNLPMLNINIAMGFAVKSEFTMLRYI